MPKVPPYSDEFKREAVKLLRSGDRGVSQLAKELGVSEGSLRNWSTQLDVDEGKAEGLSSVEREELKPGSTGRVFEAPWFARSGWSVGRGGL